MSTVAVHTANGTPSANGQATMVAARLLGGIQTKNVTHYCIGEKTIVQVTHKGRYTISATHCSYLDVSELRCLQDVIAKVLEDADRELESEHGDDDEPAPF